MANSQEVAFRKVILTSGNLGEWSQYLIFRILGKHGYVGGQLMRYLQGEEVSKDQSFQDWILEGNNSALGILSASSMNEIVQKTAVSTATRRETLFRMASRQKDEEYEYESADEMDIGVDPKKKEIEKVSDKEDRERVLLYQKSYLEALKNNKRDAKNVYTEILDSIDDRALRAVTIQKTKTGLTFMQNHMMTDPFGLVDCAKLSQADTYSINVETLKAEYRGIVQSKIENLSDLVARLQTKETQLEIAGYFPAEHVKGQRLLKASNPFLFKEIKILLMDAKDLTFEAVLAALQRREVAIVALEREEEEFNLSNGKVSGVIPVNVVAGASADLREPFVGKCFKCGVVGHRKGPDCPQWVKSEGGGKVLERKSPKCVICDQAHYFGPKCPLYEKAKKSVIVGRVEVLGPTEIDEHDGGGLFVGHLKSVKFIIDSGAGCSLVNEKDEHIITNKSKSHISIIGATGASVRADKEGILDQVSFLPIHTGTGVTDNILATADLVDAGMCFFGDKEGIEFRWTKSGPPVFVAPRDSDRMYRCTHTDIINAANRRIMNCHLEKAVFSKEEIVRAELALTAHRAGHPSDKQLILQILGGPYVHLGLVRQDVLNMRQIHGPCEACIMKANKAPTPSASLSPPAALPAQHLHADLVHLPFSNKVVLHVRDDFSRYVMGVNLRTKSKTDVTGNGWGAILTFFRQFRHKIEAVTTDSELIFKECRPWLAKEGVLIGYTPPGAHEHASEKSWQDVQKRMQTVARACQYKIIEGIEYALYEDCTFTINNEISSTLSGATPYSVVSGKRCCFHQFPGGIRLPFQTPVLTRVEDKGISPQHGIIVGVQQYSVSCYKIFFHDFNGHGPTILDRSASNIQVLSEVPDNWGWSTNKYFVPHVPFTRTTMNTARQLVIDSDTEDSAVPAGKVDSTAISGSTRTALRDHLNSTAGSGTSVLELGGAVGTTAVSGPSLTEGGGAQIPTLGGAHDRVLDNRASGDGLLKEILYGDISEHDSELGHYNSGGKERQDRPSRKAAQLDWRAGPVLQRGVLTVGIQAYLTGEKSVEGLKASDIEFGKFNEYDAGRAVDAASLSKDEKVNALPALLMFTEKVKANGEYDRTAARLAARGDLQHADDIGEVFSGTVDLVTIFTVITLMCLYNMESVAFDIKGAFLHAEIPEGEKPIYMKLNKVQATLWLRVRPQDQAYVSAEGALYIRLKKYVYGLKKAPRAFGAVIAGALQKKGYVALTTDPRAMVNPTNRSNGAILIHVDDELLIARGTQEIDDVESALIECFGEKNVKREELTSYLGMVVTRDREKGTAMLTQPKYLGALLDKYSLHDIPLQTTAAPADLFELSTDLAPVDKKLFKGLVMSAVYVARFTRADFILPASYLATRMDNPTMGDLRKVQHLYGYWRATPALGKYINPKGNVVAAMMVDASHASHVPSMSSHGGIIITVAGVPVFHQSYKIKCVCLSSTDSETSVMCEGLKFLLWVSDLLAELGYPQGSHTAVGTRNLNFSTVIQEDNKSAITQAQDECSFKRSRYTMVRMAFIRQLTAEGVVKVDYCPTKEMTADILTKPLQGAQFQYLRDKILGYSNTLYINEKV